MEDCNLISFTGRSIDIKEDNPNTGTALLLLPGFIREVRAAQDKCQPEERETHLPFPTQKEVMKFDAYQRQANS
jgi:hypothetical protein